MLSRNVRGTSPQSINFAQFINEFSPFHSECHLAGNSADTSGRHLPVYTLHAASASIRRDPCRMPRGPNLVPGLAVVACGLSMLFDCGMLAMVRLQVEINEEDMTYHQNSRARLTRYCK